LSQEEKELKSFAYFYLDEFTKASEIFQQLQEIDPEDVDYLTFQAMCLFEEGQLEKAEKLIEDIDRLRADYQYGKIDYAKARYYAVKGDTDLLIQNLIRAVAEGKRFNPGNYHDDVLMQPYVDMESFQNVLTFWH